MYIYVFSTYASAGTMKLLGLRLANPGLVGLIVGIRNEARIVIVTTVIVRNLSINLLSQ